MKIIRLKVADCDPQKEAVCTAVCVLQLLRQMVGCRWPCARARTVYRRVLACARVSQRLCLTPFTCVAYGFLLSRFLLRLIHETAQNINLHLHALIWSRLRQSCSMVNNGKKKGGGGEENRRVQEVNCDGTGWTEVNRRVTKKNGR